MKLFLIILASVFILAACGGGSAPESVVKPHLSAQGKQTSFSLTESSIGGTYGIGDTLNASNGTWGNKPTSYSYQWERCDTSGSNCTNIGGAIASSYVVQASDVSHTIRVVVTAQNSNGSNSSTSPATPTITSLTNTVQPYFTASTVNGSDSCTAGCAIVGQQMSVTTGTWPSTPTSYSYQWQDCTTALGSPGDENNISAPPTTGSCTDATGTGAATNTYTVGSGDIGKSLAVTVTASNGSNSTSTTVAGSCNTGSAPITGSPGCSPISAVAGSTQTGERFCTNAPTTCGFPDPLNHSVGVPAGTSLTPSGSITVNTNGTVINGKDISGYILVNANNVTIQNSQITGDSAITTGGVDICNTCTGTVVKYDTFKGVAPTATGELGVAVFNRGSSATLDHVEFYNGQRIIMETGDVSNSYCFGNANDPTAHYECTYEGRDHATLDHNVLLNPHPQTAAIYFALDTGQSTIGPLVATNNLLAGGSYTMYGGGNGTVVSSLTVTGNRFSRLYEPLGGAFGPVAYLPDQSNYTWSNNIWDDTGATVSTS